MVYLAGELASFPDGLIVYSEVLGANPAISGAELLEIRTDRRTGKPVSQPRAIARGDTPITNFSTSANGKELVLRDLTVQHSIYLGELEDEKKALADVRQFSFGLGREDLPRAWGADSKTLFFDSNRYENWEIFKQELGGSSDSLFVRTKNDAIGPHLGPDGKWIEASQFSEWGLRFECPQRAGRACVLAKRAGGQVVFRLFDPIKGSFLASLGGIRTTRTV